VFGAVDPVAARDFERVKASQTPGEYASAGATPPRKVMNSLRFMVSSLRLGNQAP